MLYSGPRHDPTEPFFKLRQERSSSREDSKVDDRRLLEKHGLMMYLLRREQQQKTRMRVNFTQLEERARENMTFDGLQTAHLRGKLGDELVRDESEEREKTIKLTSQKKQRRVVRARSRCWNPKLPLCFNIKALKKKNMQAYLERPSEQSDGAGQKQQNAGVMPLENGYLLMQRMASN